MEMMTVGCLGAETIPHTAPLPRVPRGEAAEDLGLL